MDGSDKRPNRLKARQSIAHIPSFGRLTGSDKQNATIDLSAARSAQDFKYPGKKRTRGKSLGPGGLEALSEIDGNAIKSTPLFQPKSILKPTVPLTPPKTIPTFDELRQRSTRKKSPAKNSTEALLIDFSTPGPSRDSNATTNTAGVSNVFDPFSPVKQLDPVYTDNVLDGTTNDDERSRQEHKKMILEQRAARRKSMANRRVSFAPEATLHTWSVMEMVEDSTTSSASNSTRRQSSMAEQYTPQHPSNSTTDGTRVSESPSTTLKQIGESLVKASPAGQRDTHQQERRRSSVISDNGDISADEMYSSSPSGDIATESSPIRVEDIDSESDTDGDTAMSMDEVTQNTIVSQASNSSTQSSLEERLRQAATQAGTRGIDDDEFDDVSMEIAESTVTNAFQPWVRSHQRRESISQTEQELDVESENTTNAHSQPDLARDYGNTTSGMAMEMTQAVGGIMNNPISNRKSHRKSMRSRQSLAADSSYGDESMDLTTVNGGILSTDQEQNDQDGQGEDGHNSSNEDLTMEFTTVWGQVQTYSRRNSMQSDIEDDNETMNMTAAVGGILEAIEENTEPLTDNESENTMAMDMTKAVGAILPANHKSPDVKEVSITHAASDAGVSISQAESSLEMSENVIESTPQQFTSIASETGSPSLALKSRSSARNRPLRVGPTSSPRSSKKTTPKQMSTPTKNLTPVLVKAVAPQRTPDSAYAKHRGASPKKLFQAEMQAKASPKPSKSPVGKPQDPLFAQDDITGRRTPRVILHAPKPHQHLRRRSSGVGVDKEGLGSPSVTQLLSRRCSIGDTASQFKLGSSPASRLRFEDPKQVADEVDAERAEDKRRESGRYVMEQEVNEHQEENTTTQLKGMIESMSPKKNEKAKMKYRKSLAVGSARGLLGKRPMELDEENEDGDSTPKRLKVVSREGSPVKNIRLPNPPTKEEVTGRLSHTEQAMLDRPANREHTPSLTQSPTKMPAAASPQQPARFRSIPTGADFDRPTSFEHKLDNVVGAVDLSIEHPPPGTPVREEDKMSLQQFLNITNVHFIELNATKRRHTLAQPMKSDDLTAEINQAESAKACFVAAATTIPLLELYQHATKELKSYISSGRKIIRSIENETLAEQPPLFREYIEARPDVKVLMDNQFRNGKTNARLQSKEGWYLWRSQLVDGLHNGLQVIQNDIQKDLLTVNEQSKSLTNAVNRLTQHCGKAKDKVMDLRQRLDELDSVDHQALHASRKELRSTHKQLAEKLAKFEKLQQQMRDKADALAQAAELRDEMQDHIVEANRVRDEHRGSTATDVLASKARVGSLKAQSGWTVMSAEEDSGGPSEFGVALTLSYQNSLRLFFYPSAFEHSADGTRRRSGRKSRSMSGPTAPVSLTYSPRLEDEQPAPPLATEKRFCLQLIQSQLHAFSMMPKGTTTTKTTLNAVSSGWQMACKISEEIRLLSLSGLTRVSILSDENLSVRSTLVLPDKSRADIDFSLSMTILNDGEISMSTSANILPVYGPVSNIFNASRSRKVQHALNKEIESRTMGEGAWLGAVQAFEGWHQSRTEQDQEQQKEQQRQQLKQQQQEQQQQQETTCSQEPPVLAGSTTPKSPSPVQGKTPAAAKRSPLATKKSTTLQKKIPVSTARQDKFRTSQREPQPQVEKPQAVFVQDPDKEKDKENADPFGYGSAYKPAITPQMQEAMMQRTPIKRIGALRRSPI